MCKSCKKRKKVFQPVILTDWLPAGLISAIAKLKNEFYKFLLLMSIALISGGIVFACVFGCIMGTIVLTLIVVFVLAALYMQYRFTCRK